MTLVSEIQEGDAVLSRERRETLGRLEEILGYRFIDIHYLNKALTHKSFAYESGKNIKNNERLEFLGDAVFDLMVSDYMLVKFPKHQEGALSKIRSVVVSEGSLAKIAKNLNLGEFILLGRGEELSGGRNKPSILANALEAVGAAIYLDGGYEKTASVLLQNFSREIDQAASTNNYQDYKSELQERTQVRLNIVPQYRVARDTGPDHDKTFEVNVLINGVAYGFGVGKSKKEAEQQAARSALERGDLPF